MKTKEYIESGILEAYVLGSASETEAQELLQLKEQYPEIRLALTELELDLEHIAQQMAIAPPPGTLEKIEANLHGLIPNPELKQIPGIRKNKDQKGKGRKRQNSDNQFIEVEGSSSHMRIHKIWRWIFAAVFILGKIFLAFAIYFYLENRQAQKQILKLEQQSEQRSYR